MTGGLPILCYHGFGAAEDVLTTNPARFAGTMAALHAAGCRCVDLDEWIAAGRPEVPDGFALTFDDGLRSILDVLPVLERYRFPATVFLVTDRMGRDNAWPGQPSWVARRGLLDWSDLPALHAARVRVAAHSRTHPDLRTLDDPALDAELRGARDAIEARTGRACRLLAYPYGLADRRVRRRAAEHYAAAFDTRLRTARASEDRHAIARIDAFYLRTAGAMDSLIAGTLDRHLRWRRVARRARQSMVAGLGRVRPRAAEGSRCG